MKVLLALDLSLRGLGMIAMPENWKGQWTKIGRRTFTSPLPKDAPQLFQTQRLDELANAVIKFAQANAATEAVIEQYSFGSMQSRAHALGELGGAVKLELFRRMAIVAEPVSILAARKFLLGRSPKKTEVLGPRKKDQGGKAWAQEGARRAGCPEAWTEHERDAWVTANCRAGELGWYAVTGMLTAILR